VGRVCEMQEWELFDQLVWMELQACDNCTVVHFSQFLFFRLKLTPIMLKNKYKIQSLYIITSSHLSCKKIFIAKFRLYLLLNCTVYAPGPILWPVFSLLCISVIESVRLYVCVFICVYMSVCLSVCVSVGDDRRQWKCYCVPAVRAVRTGQQETTNQRQLMKIMLFIDNSCSGRFSIF